MKLPVLFVTAAALIDAEGRVLLAQRPYGKDLAGLWEFPGGKVHDGETPEEALARELKEELDIVVVPSDLEPLTFASHAYEKFHLFMPLFVCRIWQGELCALEKQKLAWAAPCELGDYSMPAADGPLAEFLKAHL